MASENNAIIFGASGLLGWAVSNELLSGYGSFESVTAIMNRPVDEKDLHLPSNTSTTLKLLTGVDLTKGAPEDLAAQLGSLDHITHAFYFVFSPNNDDFVLERKKNCEMLSRVAGALNLTSPKLESIVYSGGTRGYGIYLPGGTFSPPLKESMADELPPDYEETVAYPYFRRLLTEASKGRKWTWTEVCPDAVVGFSPNGSGYSLALLWAQYLSLYRAVHSEGAEVPFPGKREAFDAKFSPVSGRMLGRISIHAALNPSKCGGKVVNMLDQDEPTSFRTIWRAIAEKFGLKGTSPTSVDEASKPSEFIAKHGHLFKEAGLERAMDKGVGAGGSQLDNVGVWLTFDRQLCHERLRSVGFVEQRDPCEGWIEAVERLREAGIVL